LTNSTVIGLAIEIPSAALIVFVDTHERRSTDVRRIGCDQLVGFDAVNTLDRAADLEIADLSLATVGLVNQP